MPELRLEKLVVLELGPISLSVGASEIVCLSGESGAGKSLLLRAIADLIPHQGKVFMDGQSSYDMPAPVWRRQVGLLPAESQWWYDSIGEHFVSADVKVFDALAMPKDALQWTVSRCSTGEKQRLALLRLLANQPGCLLLDEPTGSLDPDNTRRVEVLIQQLVKDRKMPVLWVSHSNEQIRRIADRHFIISEGGLVEHD
jgi:putative ABC transport system ATP-binding protein